MENITETKKPVKGIAPGLSLKDLTPEQSAEEITIKMPRGIAAFVAEDLERFSDHSLLKVAPPEVALRGLGWLLAASLIKEGISNSLLNPQQN